MVCPSCSKENTQDSFFCTWCSAYMPSPVKGSKAGLFQRFMALVLDPLIALVLYLGAIAVVGGVTGSADAGVVAAVLFPIMYFIWYLTLMRQGLSPGKKLFGLRVIDHQTGEIPGFGKMFVRELVGRSLSGFVFGIGYLWAIFDKNAQAWHDKIAGTVVVRGR